MNFPGEVEIRAPGLFIRFTASKERIARLMAVILEEAGEAEQEEKERLKQEEAKQKKEHICL